MEISHAVGSVMELGDILQRIVETGARIMETNTCSVYLRDDDEPEFLVLHASWGLSRAEELGVRGFRWGEGLPGWSAQHNQTVALANDRHDGRWAQLDDTAKEAELKAYLGTPLRIQDDVAGVLTFRRAAEQDWTHEEVIFAEFIAKQVAIVLEKASLYEEKVEAERLAAIAVSLSGVAHYIKNVLQNMMGGSYFVETGLKRGDVDKARKGWELLQRSIGKIQALVENMLTYSRDWKCELEPLDVNAMLAQMAQQVEPSAFAKGIRLTLELDERLPELQADEDALHDAVLNLVTNAVDVLEENTGGEVCVRTRRDDAAGVARICVVDNGPGIPPDVQEKMFTLFFTTKGRGGTGIGLSVTHRIIAEHHGSLSFDSSPDEGTTFTIELPLNTDRG